MREIALNLYVRYGRVMKMMVNDEQLELDEVAGDFCDWFSERIHIHCVRQSNEHYLFMRNYQLAMRFCHQQNVEQLFGHRLKFYTR